MSATPGSKTPPARSKSVSPPLSSRGDASSPASPGMSRKLLKKEESKREAYLSQEIDKALKEEELSRKRNPIQKMVLLGPADSGKTTLLKQMKILHGDGFSEHEREEFRVKIIHNIMRAMQAILKECVRLSFALSPANNDNAEKVAKVDVQQDRDTFDGFPEFIAKAVTELWKDPGVQHCYHEVANCVQDTIQYFFDNMGRIGSIEYKASDQDILMARSRTMAVNETDFLIRNRTFRVIDVGGQKSHRAAWAIYFEDASAIVFIVSMASYDQMMEEDPTTNKMADCLQLFQLTSNHILLKKIPIILLLNKTDLATKKIKKSSVRKYFPELEASSDEKDFKVIKSFFKKKFCELSLERDKEVYVHYTSNVDTKLMKVIIQAVLDIVTKALLRSIDVI